MHSVTSSSSEPSHDYLQTLLNVNDELLAQSLASTTHSNSADGDFSNYHTQDHYPHRLKSSAFTSHTQDLPASPAISQEENDINPSIQLLTQFTPPITPE